MVPLCCSEVIAEFFIFTVFGGIITVQYIHQDKQESKAKVRPAARVRVSRWLLRRRRGALTRTRPRLHDAVRARGAQAEGDAEMARREASWLARHDLLTAQLAAMREETGAPCPALATLRAQSPPPHSAPLRPGPHCLPSSPPPPHGRSSTPFPSEQCHASQWYGSHRMPVPRRRRERFSTLLAVRAVGAHRSTPLPAALLRDAVEAVQSQQLAAVVHHQSSQARHTSGADQAGAMQTRRTSTPQVAMVLSMCAAVYYFVM